MSHPYLESSDSSFKTDVLDFSGVTIVDFWAPWCGPCQMLGPIVEEIGTDYAKQPEAVRVVKINVDDNPEVSEKYDVRSIPTLKFFAKGEMKDSIIGVVPKAEIVRKIEGLL